MAAERRKVQGAAAQLPEGYAELLEDLKARIRSAQVRAALSVNREEAIVKQLVSQMGVATYRVTDALPAELQESLPSLEELEAELGAVKSGDETRAGEDSGAVGYGG